MKPLPLTRARVVAAALALIDRDGLEALSMRKLGAALGVEGMAVYHHVPGKEPLLDAVVERLLEEVELPADPATDWIDWLRHTARSYRAVARRHPNAFPLLAARRYATEATFRHLEKLFAVLRNAGLDPQMTARAFRTIGYFINGAGLADIATLAARRDPRRGTALDAFRDPGGLAHVASVAPHLRLEQLDAIFEFGLDLLLDGLREAAKSAGRRSKPG